VVIMMMLKRSKTQQKKISATFIDFVSPTLRLMGLSPANPESDVILRACWTTWNAVVYADFFSRTDFLDAMLDRSRSSPASVILVKSLVDRKRSRRFVDDDRLIGEWKIKDVNGDLRLWAEARRPNLKDRDGQTPPS
jgi:hypothetical protein